jgi:FOG: WD40 repeat
VYHAFLSYSHRADALLAPVLQRALERLGTPFWRRAGIRVFRDDASLPASAALWPSIQAALEKSQHLVLLASPSSAESVWVEREVRWWLANRAPEQLLIVVTAGELAYDEAARDFDWQQTTCLPAALREVFTSEPYWTDLRFARGPEHRTLRNSRFRSAALAVAAAIRGVPKDDLESADILQHRRSVGLASAGAALVGVLALATAVAVYIARSESESASSNRKDAESRRLAAAALVDLDQGRGVETATLKAAIAWRLAPTEEARRAIQRIDETTPDIARVLGQHTGSPSSIAFSRDGSRLASGARDGVVLQWSLADGRAWGAPLASEHQYMRQLSFSADGSHILVNGTRSEEPRGPAISVFRVADAKRLTTGNAWLDLLRRGGSQSDTVCAAISPSGARLAVAAGHTLLVNDLASAATKEYALPPKTRVTAVGFAGEDRINFVIDDEYGDWSKAGFADARGGLTLGAKAAQVGGQCGFTSFSDDGSHFGVYGGKQGWLSFWKIEEGRLRRLPSPQLPSSELTGHYAPAWDATGKRVAYGVSGTGYVWDFAAQRVLKTTKRFSSGHGPPLALSPDGRLLAALDGDTPVVWTLEQEGDGQKINGLRCGQGLDNACIQRLCERITSQRDDRRWRELLGDQYPALLTSLKGTQCADG